MAKPIHSMIRVLEETRSVEFYSQAFGLTVATRLPFDGFTLVYMKSAESDFELELTINGDRSEPYGLGDGYGHLAFVVDDLEAEHTRFVALGFTPNSIKEFMSKGSLLAKFFFVSDPDNYKIEVLQKHGRYR